MDLHDVADIVEEHAIEAHRAIHAGHSETTYKYFKVIMEQIRAYFEQMSPAEVAALAENKGQAYSMANAGATKASDVTESATSEKAPEDVKETQAQAAGGQVPKKGVVPFDVRSKHHAASQFQPPAQ